MNVTLNSRKKLYLLSAFRKRIFLTKLKLMKKIYFSVAFVMSAVLAMAQLPQQPGVAVVNRAERLSISTGADNRVPTDTLGLDIFAPNGTVIQYGLQGGGYILGNNSQMQQGLDIKTFEIAQAFAVSSIAYNVEGAMFFFAAKEAVSSTPAGVDVTVYELGPDVAYGSTSSTTPDAVGPSSASSTASIAFADIDTTFGMPTFVTFPQPTWVSSDFAIGVSIEGTYAGQDTVVLYGDELGDGGGLNFLYHRFGVVGNPLELWYVSSAAFTGPGGEQFDINSSIFAIVATSDVSVGDEAFLDGMQLSQNYPNPANGLVTIDYALEKYQEKATLEVYAANGQLVHKIENKDQKAGKHTVKIDANLFSSGTYFYSLEVNGKRLTKKMLIAK